MKIFLIILSLGFAVSISGCATDPGSGAESQDKNEPAPRSRSRAY